MTHTFNAEVPLQLLTFFIILCCKMLCDAVITLHFVMQLLHLDLAGNKLMGSLPESWGHLSNVSPVVGASSYIHCLKSSSQFRSLSQTMDPSWMLQNYAPVWHND